MGAPCRIEIDYVVDEYGTRYPFIEVSKANSIGFIMQEDVNDCSVFKNDNNSFAFNSNVSTPHCTKLLFNTCDNIKIQFKSSYDDISVDLRSELGVDINIPITQLTSNLGRFGSMDCFFQRYVEDPTKLMVWFMSGNTYDETGIINGAYELNGNLPDFAIVGETVDFDNFVGFPTIPGYTGEILDVVYVESLNANAIIFDGILFSDTTYTARAKSLYNLLPFEVYEFTIDWTIYGEGLFDVLINFEDSNPAWTPMYYLSENIWIKDKHEDVATIKYYNNNNRDIFYKFPIEHLIRIPLLHIKAFLPSDEDINITDASVSVIKATLNDGNTYIFDAITRDVYLKLSIALSMENLWIDGIGYIKKDMEMENIENTNLYNVIASLVKTGKNYNNISETNTGIPFGEVPVDLPIFITDGINIIKE